MSETGPALALSIVVPVYNEEGNVAPLHGELTRAAHQLGRPYELVFVNDGSRDGTLARLTALRARDENLRIVDLDGNFGEAAALSAGFAHARGALVVTLDGDGQNDPADIPRLLARLGPELDVVSGRASRTGSSRARPACPCTTPAAASRSTGARWSRARSSRAA